MTGTADPRKAQEVRLRSVTDGHARGWSFVPLNGKKPRLKGWTSRPRETADEAVRWATDGNIGLRTGSVSGGLIVIDIDAQKGGSMDGFDLPQTVTVNTGGGGKHLYFVSQDRWSNSRGALPDHVDVRGEGGQVVAAGSTHPETRLMYEYAPGCAPWELEIAPLPAVIATALRSPRAHAHGAGPRRVQNPGDAREILEAEARQVQRAVEGTRNDTLNKSAYSMGPLIREGRIDRNEVERTLVDASTLPLEEARKTIQSGLEAGIRMGRPLLNPEFEFNLTDAGNGERFAAQHQERAVYDTALGKWRLWDGRRWALDPSDRVLVPAIETARQIKREAERCTDETRRHRLVAFADQSQNIRRLRAMVEIARSQPGMALGTVEWNPDPYMLNVLNGTIDLKTGILRAHAPADRITHVAPVEFDSRAGCRRFYEFVREIFRNDPGLIDYVQRLLGMCLTGDVSEQILAMMIGAGANGKSTLLDVVADIMGDYAAVAPPDLLNVRRHEEHPTELADLMGRRMVIASETDKGGRFALQRVKRLTGDKMLKARRMREDYVEFPRLFKLILVTNNPPQVDEDSEAVWRRIKVVPFEFIVPEDRRDRHLLETLREERTGILQWLLEGCRNWVRTGLIEPPTVLTATEKYRRHSTPARQFLAERCILDPAAWTRSDQLNQAFCDWCEQRGSHFESVKGVLAALRAAGCTDKKRAQVRGWAGIRLLPQ